MMTGKCVFAAVAAATVILLTAPASAQTPKAEEPAPAKAEEPAPAEAEEPAPKVVRPAIEAKNNKDKSLMAAAQKVADAIAAKDFELFEKKLMVDRKRYSHFYEKVHSIEIAARGWQEYVDGLRENFTKKSEKMKEAKLTFRQLDFGKEKDFQTCELWADFLAKGAAAGEEEVREELILHFTKIRGKWVVVSVE